MTSRGLAHAVAALSGVHGDILLTITTVDGKSYEGLVKVDTASFCLIVGDILWIAAEHIVTIRKAGP